MPLPKDAATFRALVDGYVVTCDKTPDEITVAYAGYVVHTGQGAELDRGVTWGEVLEIVRLHAAQRENRRQSAARG
jgi:hypothetical protein